MIRGATRLAASTCAALALLLSFAVRGAPLWGQLVELSGGASTLSESQGGTISVRGMSYGGSVGGGTISGHFFGGGQLVKKIDRTTLTLGTDTIPFNFPTDIFGSDHFLAGVGAGVTSQIAATHFRGFVGTVANQFDSPFFTGAQGGSTAAVLYETTPLNPKLTSYANVILSHKISAINSLQWNLGGGAKFALSMGLGSNLPYGAVSASVDRPGMNLKAAYYGSAGQFRRADVQTPLTSEADRENVVLTFYPSRNLTFTLGRQNYLSPVYGSATDIRSTVNQVSGTVQAHAITASGSVLQSNYAGSSNVSVTGSVGRQFGPRISVQETVLASKPQDDSVTTAYVTNVEETLTPRWSLSQVLNRSNSTNTLGFGGSFLSNLATLSAEYQTYYVPSRPESPFEQALILNARVQVLSRLTLNGATFVSPTGKLLYTASAESTLSRQPIITNKAFDRDSIGKAGLRGRVVDTAGLPVEGAALLLDQMPLYTDSDGYFYMNEQKVRWHKLKVLGDKFLDGRRYRVVTAPLLVRSSLYPDQNELKVVVEGATRENE